MSRIITFQSMTLIPFGYNNFTLTSVLKLPAVFITVILCTGCSLAAIGFKTYTVSVAGSTVLSGFV